MDNEGIIKNEGARGTRPQLLVFIRSSIHYAATSLKKNIVSATIIFAVIIVAGCYNMYTDGNRNYYETNMACVSNSLNNKIIGEMVEKLNILAKTESYNELASALNVDRGKASSIISINTKNVFGKEISNDTAHRSNTLLYFIVKAKKRDVYTDLQPALLNYLNGTSYQERRTQSEKNRIDSKALFIHADLAQIDSIVSSYPAFLKHITSISISDSTGSFFDVSNIISLLSYKDKAEDRLLFEAQTKNFMMAVEMVHGFLCPEKPENETGKIILTMLGMAFSAALAWSLTINMIRNGVYKEIT